MEKDKLTIGITMGDPAGIGPEVILKSLRERAIQGMANYLIIGNSFALEVTSRVCKMKLPLKDICLLDVGNMSKLTFGQGRLGYGKIALECIRTALRLLNVGRIDALVTAPVNKHTISQNGRPFKGHTEYLAKADETKHVAMMLIAGPFKVALVTRHLALKDVPVALTSEKVYQTIRLSADALKRYFAIRRPRIGVCALNPHAGEGGTLGREEAQIIRPALLRAKKFAFIEGPLPADSIFYLAAQGKFDAVVAMYHDQGLIPLKTFAFHQGVNVTLGLSFVRTSPDHGTAYDIAGKNKANPGSMIEAIKLAADISSKLKREKK